MSGPRKAFPPPFQLSRLEIAREGLVIINHPGVGHPLFMFPAYSGEPDPSDPSATVSGICYHLVLDSCRVITNHAANHQDDVLAKDREGTVPLPSDNLKPLTPGDYYYFLGPPEDAANCNYPIVKSFSAFRFPSRIPDHWYHTRDTARRTRGRLVVIHVCYVTSRDKHCALSGYQSFNRCAHLVPQAEEAWFAANKMCLYSLDNMEAGVNTHTNGVSLRDDLHRCLESSTFVFYPASDPDGGAFMAYFVGMGGYPDYTELFHRRLAAIHPSVAVEFLYARFAYAVIKLWRPDVFFDSVPDNEDVKVFEKAASELLPPGEGEDTDDGNSDISSSSASNHSMQSPLQESYADGDQRWKEELVKRIPAIAALEEINTVACHTETPHMLRLASKYMRENPQVWKTSTTPEGAIRDDIEGFYAKWITWPSSA